MGRAFPPAAATFFRAASEARNAPTVTGKPRVPLDRRIPGTATEDPFAAWRATLLRFTSGQFRRGPSSLRATARQIGASCSRARAFSSRIARSSSGFTFTGVCIEKCLRKCLVKMGAI